MSQHMWHLNTCPNICDTSRHVSTSTDLFQSARCLLSCLGTQIIERPTYRGCPGEERRMSSARLVFGVGVKILRIFTSGVVKPSQTKKFTKFLSHPKIQDFPKVHRVLEGSQASLVLISVTCRWIWMWYGEGKPKYGDTSANEDNSFLNHLLAETWFPVDFYRKSFNSFRTLHTI